VLLDVGCGSGRYLDRARSLGWETHGVEPSQEAAEIANANGHKVVVGDIANSDYPSNSFDYIQFWHVLEHIHDPMNTLRRARSWLKDTGTVGIAAPNADSLGAFMFGNHWFHLDAPRHLFAFNPTSIARLLSDSGFLMTEFETYSHLSDWLYSLRLGGSDRDRLAVSVLAKRPMLVILGLVERLADLAGRGEHLRVSARPV
jgi:SAM-dependent methyltransferase